MINVTYQNVSKQVMPFINFADFVSGAMKELGINQEISDVQIKWNSKDNGFITLNEDNYSNFLLSDNKFVELEIVKSKQQQKLDNPTHVCKNEVEAAHSQDQIKNDMNNKKGKERNEVKQNSDISRKEEQIIKRNEEISNSNDNKNAINFQDIQGFNNDKGEIISQKEVGQIIQNSFIELDKIINDCAFEYTKSIPNKMKMPTKEELEDNIIISNAYHQGTVCCGCGMKDIVGIRYKCAVCIKYDLCQKCESCLGSSHKHPLYKLKYPILNSS